MKALRLDSNELPGFSNTLGGTASGSVLPVMLLVASPHPVQPKLSTTFSPPSVLSRGFSYFTQISPDQRANPHTLCVATARVSTTQVLGSRQDLCSR